MVLPFAETKSFLTWKEAILVGHERVSVCVCVSVCVSVSVSVSVCVSVCP